MPNFGLDRQIELYTGGDAQRELPVSFDAWDTRARELLSPSAYAYVAGGAGSGGTMANNAAAFARRRICPRVLRDVAQRDLSVELFGSRIPAPIALAPIGVQGILHSEGERAPARAAAGLGLPFTLSTVSSVTIEEVAAEMGTGTRWFQLYPSKDRSLTASLVGRAERAGYSALIVTLDTTMLGWRERDLELGYLPFLHGKGMANYLSDPVFREQLAQPPEADLRGAVEHFLSIFINPSFSWSDLAFVRELTGLPLILKGILHPDDAIRALDLGIDGIVVSNHGGRQVDRAVAALDALAGVCAAAAGRIPVLMDSGIRHGADVFMALAMGASAVLLGRPYAYGLAVAGEAGVYTVLRNLLAELDLQTGLAGCRTAAEIADASVEER